MIAWVFLAWYLCQKIKVPVEKGKSHLTDRIPEWLKIGICSLQFHLWDFSLENSSWKDYLIAVLNNRLFCDIQRSEAPCGTNDICTASQAASAKEDGGSGKMIGFWQNVNPKLPDFLKYYCK